MRSVLQQDQKYCHGCPLFREKRNRTVYIPTDVVYDRVGDDGETPKVDLLVIGEAPSRTEDNIGMPFAGAAGRELGLAMEKAGVKGSYALANVVRCRPQDEDGKNRPPSVEEIAACSNYIKQDIESLDPKVIVMIGNQSIRTLSENPDWGTKGARALQGQVHLAKDGRTHLITVHPSAYLRSESKPQRRRFFRHIKSAGRFVSGKQTIFSARGEVELITDFDYANEVLDWYEFKCKVPVALDSETKNLNQVAKNGVATVQLSADNDFAHVFPFGHKDSPWTKAELKHLRKRMRRLLISKKTKIPSWIMHNAQFDMGIVFTYFRVKKIAKPVFDTMFLAFLQDENQCGDSDGGKIGFFASAFSLKTLARELLGFYFYDTELSDALAARYGASGGSLWDLPLDRLSEYGGTDAYVTRRIFTFFKEWLERQGYSAAFPFAEKWYGKVAHLLTKMSANGFPVDVDQLGYLRSDESPILSRLAELPKLIYKTKEARKANDILLHTDDRTAGMKPLFGRKPWIFSLRKPDHQVKLFIEACGLTPLSEGKSGKPSIDKAFFDKYKHHPVVGLFKEYKGLEKLRSSYLESVEEILYSKEDNRHDGRIHAGFHAVRTVTGRLACLPEGTRISTDKGLVPIEEVRAGDSIQTEMGTQKVNSAWAAGTKKILEFSLDNGRKLRCSPLHKVFVNGKWKLAKDIAEGDDLYVSGVTGPDTSFLSELTPLTSLVGRSNKPTLPTLLGEREAFLLGHLVAEGCIGYNNKRPTKLDPNRTGKVPSKVIVALGWEEKPLRDFIIKEWKDLFGVDFVYHEYGSPTIECSSVDLARWLIVNDFGYKSRDAIVPESIFRSGILVRKAFIRGLFEGDGGSSHGDIRFDTESPKLLKGVSTLLASIGIHHSCTNNKRKNNRGTRYHITLSTDQDVSWVFWSDRKVKCIRPNSIFLGVKKPHWFDFDSLWPSIKNYHSFYGRDACKSAAYHRLRKTKNPKARLTGKVQDLMVPALASSSCTSDSSKFVTWAKESHAKSSTVLSIKSKGRQKVYDLEVPSTNSFLVDGIVVHNSSNPNLQQLPKGKKNNAKAAIRSMYGAAPGHILIECDFGQAEVRWWAQLAGDKQYAKLFHEMKDLRDEYKRTGDKELGKKVKLECDIHKKVAALMFRMELDGVTPELRQKAKALCFGSIFGQHFKTLAAILGITPDEALNLQETFVQEFEKAGQWLTDIEREAVTYGIVSTPMGRVRHLQDFLENDENGAKRRARNSPIQAVSSDTTALCAWRIQNWIEENNRPYKVINCVHDAVTMEVPLDFDMVKETVWLLQEMMVDSLPQFLKDEFDIDMILPMEIDYDFGVRWGHMLSYDGVEKDLRPIFDRCVAWDKELQEGTQWHEISYREFATWDCSDSKDKAVKGCGTENHDSVDVCGSCGKTKD